MTGKNLLLKFGIVLLLVLGCVLGIHYYGIKLGIDLRGGYSLIYELRPAEGQTSVDSGLVDKVIATLKNRIDPNGLRSLEWIPLGANRLEVRMPVAREDSQQAKGAYIDAREKLREGNLQPGVISRIETLSGEALKTEIESLSKGDAALEQSLGQMVQAYGVKRQAAADSSAAKAALDAALGKGDQKAIEKARAAYNQALGKFSDASDDYSDKFDKVRLSNVNIMALDGILSLYVSPSEAKSIGNDKAARRSEAFQTRLGDFRKKHPSRLADIDNVVSLYKKWADVRRSLDDPADLKRLIAKSGQLSFRIAPTSKGEAGLTDADLDRYTLSLRTEGPDGMRKRNEKYLWFPIVDERMDPRGYITADFGGMRYMLLSNEPAYIMIPGTGDAAWSLAKAYSTYDDMSQPAVGFTFDPRGAVIFGSLTERHKGKMMAVLLDDQIYSAPRIKQKITESGIINGSFTNDEVTELVRVMEAGSLPARLNPNPVAESTFGPGIGQENMDSAIRVGYWGFTLVVFLMLIYYMKCGFVADIALALNVLLVLGAMATLRATLTLPGIAGIILAIGMAVDANVLIYERLREEQLKGQSIRMALKNAYDRAFSAIFDSNFTTIVICVILGWLGTEEVRGFAITLGLGVIFNLFTAVTVTRWVFQAMLGGKIIGEKLSMMRLISVPKIDWFGKRFYFWAFSLATLIVGVVSLAWQGKDIFGVEFTSGTQATIQFKDDSLLNGQLPNDGLVREMFSKQAAATGSEKLRDTSKVETVINPRQVAEFLNDNDKNKDGNVSRQEWQALGKNPKYFELLSGGAEYLTAADLQKKLPPTWYQISTSETSVDAISKTAADAFGDGLATRTPIKYELVCGQNSPSLGVITSADGETRITQQLIDDASASIKGELANYLGGVLFVVKLESSGAATSQHAADGVRESEIRQRIRDMRLQPDFSECSANSFAVIGIGQANDNAYTSFAILVTPEDQSVASKDVSWRKFADSEKNLLKNAMESQQAMLVMNFDAAIAGEAKAKAIMALVLGWMAMIAYLWIRFGSIRWGMAAVACLIQNVMIVVGLVAVSGWLHSHFIGKALGIDSFKIDLTMVTAILTLVGYNINDTIVVFDRIRENRGKLTGITPQIINDSVNQTMSRTLLTGGTTVMVVLMMYIWGGDGIHAFNYALFIGILFGTYSSIAVAAPLLLPLRTMMFGKLVSPSKPAAAEVKQENSPGGSV